MKMLVQFGAVSVLFLFHHFVYCQEQPVVQPQQLSYHAELPLEHSYEVVKNLSNQAIPEEILLKINAYRRADDDYLWVVNEELEILIRKF
jgi:hypothetical protein